MTATDLARLRWRCRRGLLELDVLLQRFLDRRYGELTPSEREAFEQLLTLPDPELLGYLRGDEVPSHPSLKELVRKIRQ